MKYWISCFLFEDGVIKHLFYYLLGRGFLSGLIHHYYLVKRVFAKEKEKKLVLWQAGDSPNECEGIHNGERKVLGPDTEISFHICNSNHK